MDPVSLVVLGVVGVAASTVALGRIGAYRAGRAWARYARAHGYDVPSHGTGFVATRDGLTIIVAGVERAGGMTVIRVMSPNIPSNFRLKGRRGGPTGSYGDPDFDASIVVVGDRQIATALLTPKVRKLAIGILTSEESQVAQRAVEFKYAGWLVDERRLSSTIDSFCELAKALEISADDLPGRLLSAADLEDVPRIRRRALRLLYQHHSESKAAIDNFSRFSNDDDPAVRLFASLCDDDGGVSALLEGILSDRLHPTLRIFAASQLASRYRAGRADAAIKRALSVEQSAVLRALIRGVADRQSATFSKELQEVMARPDHEATILRELARAARKTKDGQMEGVLLESLSHPDTAVKLAIIQALAVVGSPRSVAPLQALRSQLLLHPQLRRWAEEAIDWIQSRISPAMQGQLSLIGTGESQMGGLALAEGGDVSLSPEDS